MPLPTRTTTGRKYWRYGLVEFANNTYSECWLARDGLIFIFPNELAPMLNRLYPAHDALGWYFGESRDRFIAEWQVEGIAINPQFVQEHAVSETYDD